MFWLGIGFIIGDLIAFVKNGKIKPYFAAVGLILVFVGAG